MDTFLKSNPFTKSEEDNHAEEHTVLNDPPQPFRKLDDKDQTLHTILFSTELQNAFKKLIKDVTNTMRADITAIFDPRFVDQTIFTVSEIELAGTTEPIGKDSHEKRHENPKAAKIPNHTDLEAARERARNRIITQLSRPEVQDLKKNVLSFYDQWVSKLLQRVTEVLAAPGKQEAVDKVIPVSDQIKVEDSSQFKYEHPHHDNDHREEVDETETLDEINPESQLKLETIYAPTITTLTTVLPAEQLQILLNAVLLLTLSLDTYSAYSRILLQHLYISLQVPLSKLSVDERNTAATLVTALNISTKSSTKDSASNTSTSRYIKVGLAAVAGAAVIGISGGLAAPLIAAGLGEVLGGVGLGATVAAEYLGAMAASQVLMGGLFGAYGASMSGKMMDKYAKEVKDFAMLPVHTSKRHKRGGLKGLLRKEDDKDANAEGCRSLRVCIGITGWLKDKEEILSPWHILSTTTSAFALRWELETLLRLGNSIGGMLQTQAWAFAKRKIIQKSMLGVLYSAMWPLEILKAAELVDNPFSVGLSRADSAGDVLADALFAKIQGGRPVTLIGYSLGARLIRRCLVKLAERGAFGLIENVIFMGLPGTADSVEWRQMRAVVAGRLINIYSEKDMVLAFLYRSNTLTFGVAGLQAVPGVKGIENLDASDVITGHLRYRFLVGNLLRKIGFEDLDLERVEEEEAEFQAIEEIEEKERKMHEAANTDGEKSDEIQVVKEEVEEKTNASMTDWAKAQLTYGKDTVGALWSTKKAVDNAYK